MRFYLNFDTLKTERLKKMEKQYAQNPAIENILTRRSIRSYTDQDVEPEKIEAILEAGMAAPSGKNGQPWDFIVLTPPGDPRRDGRAFAVCQDVARGPRGHRRLCRPDQVAVLVRGLFGGGGNILLAAHALGLGAVWTATYPYRDRMDVVKELCGLPGSYDSLCVIPVGYPAREARPKDNFDAGKIHHEVY